MMGQTPSAHQREIIQQPGKNFLVAAAPDSGKMRAIVALVIGRLVELCSPTTSEKSLAQRRRPRTIGALTTRTRPTSPEAPVKIDFDGRRARNQTQLVDDGRARLAS